MAAVYYVTYMYYVFFQGEDLCSYSGRIGDVPWKKKHLHSSYCIDLFLQLVFTWSPTDLFLECCPDHHHVFRTLILAYCRQYKYCNTHVTCSAPDKDQGMVKANQCDQHSLKNFCVHSVKMFYSTVVAAGSLQMLFWESTVQIASTQFRVQLLNSEYSVNKIVLSQAKYPCCCGMMTLQVFYCYS